MATKSKDSLSLPKTKKIHGVEIKKMPCGKYFKALQKLRELPENFIEELTKDNFDVKLSEVFDLKNITIVITRLLIILPDFSINFLAELLEINVDKLKNELSPKEVGDIVSEFWKINELESFFDQMKSVVSKIMTVTGFKK